MIYIFTLLKVFLLASAFHSFQNCDLSLMFQDTVILKYFPFAASKLLNPVALFRSASSRSSSSRFLMNSSNPRDEDYEGTDDPSEEHCLFSVSHQSTLDRLHAWEKKLYEEVKVYY